MRLEGQQPGNFNLDIEAHGRTTGPVGLSEQFGRSVPRPKEAGLGERLAPWAGKRRFRESASDESPKENTLNDRPEFLTPYVFIDRYRYPRWGTLLLFDSQFVGGFFQSADESLFFVSLFFQIARHHFWKFITNSP